MKHRIVEDIMNTEDGRGRLSKIRFFIRIHNLIERSQAGLDPSYVPKLLRVDVYGRLGKNNPMSEKYNRRGFYVFPTTRISMKDSAWFKVYINPVRRHADGSTYIDSKRHGDTVITELQENRLLGLIF